MKKLSGLALFLLILYLSMLQANEGARSGQHHFNLAQDMGHEAILTLGAGLLIITGGIDLSMGSVVALAGTAFTILVVEQDMNLIAAGTMVLAGGAFLGLLNGVLVSWLRVQAFIVTLCGLFIYRGAARWLASGQEKGLGEHYGGLVRFLKDFPEQRWPMYLLFFLGLAAVATVFLHLSIYGRYWFALGSNERAARYAGIPTNRYKVMAFALCSGLAALYGILFVLKYGSVTPSSSGNFKELYAIAAAVLGGCSLRGGEGTVLGIMIGTAILGILPSLAVLWGITNELEPVVIGFALLLGAILDELLRRRGAVR